MGRIFLITLEGSFYSCKHCRTHLGLSADILSKSFQCRHGKTYLFDKVMLQPFIQAIALAITNSSPPCVNVTVGEKEERMMMTGMHIVVDRFCVGCISLVGWEYSAHEKSQEYKEGKYILERFQVLGPDGSQHRVYQEAQVEGNNDAEDA